MAIEIGTVCIKTRGRDAGSKVVVVDFEKDFAIVGGLKAKRRKCNIGHLFPTKEKIKVNKGAKQAEIEKLLK